jgi:hypothetical protein
MTRLAILLSAAGLPTIALAHPGHLAAVAGHDHWDLLGGLAVLALAVGAVAWAGRKA